MVAFGVFYSELQTRNLVWVESKSQLVLSNLVNFKATTRCLDELDGQNIYAFDFLHEYLLFSNCSDGGCNSPKLESDRC